MKTILKNIIIVFFVIVIPSSSFTQTNPKKSDESSGKVWGLAFGDYFYKAGGDSVNTALEYSQYKKDFNAFAFRRIYLGYDYIINKNFETRFILAYDGDDLNDNKRTVIVKDASLKWKDIFTNTNLTIGIIPTIAYSYSTETVWGYRAIERTQLDLRGILSSRDLGIMLNGTFDKDKNYGYYLMAGNGSGVRIETNKHKRFYASLFFNFLKKKLLTSLYSDYEPSDAAANGESKNKITYSAFIGYAGDNFSAGAEGFMQVQKNFGLNVSTNSSFNIIPVGLSFFTHGTISKDKLKFFARYDYWNPDNNNSSAGFNQNFVTIGLDFTPQKNVHIMPNLWLNAYTARDLEPTKRKSIVVPRITFWYEYR